jgi:hypothetical protein
MTWQLPTPASEAHPDFVQQKPAHAALAHADAERPIALRGFIGRVGQQHFRKPA